MMRDLRGNKGIYEEPEVISFSLQKVLKTHRDGQTFIVKLPSSLSRRDFYQEKRVLEDIQHPNVVRMVDQSAEGEMCFLVLEYLQDSDMRSVIERDGPLSVYSCVSVFLDICDALHTCHEQGILHRDVKPANIMLGNQPKLIDFGLARHPDLEEGPRPRRMGTPQYMSPEAFVPLAQTPKSDIYSLGATLFTALSGHVPFICSTQADIRLQQELGVPAILHNNSNIPSDLANIVDKACKFHPAERFQSASEFQKALLEADLSPRPYSFATPAFGKSEEPAPLTIRRCPPRSDSGEKVLCPAGPEGEYQLSSISSIFHQ